jgi:hypothetical protein
MISELFPVSGRKPSKKDSQGEKSMDLWVNGSNETDPGIFLGSAKWTGSQTSLSTSREDG